MVPDLVGSDARTRAVEKVLRRLAARGVIRGWRDEPYCVAAAPEQPALFLMERAGIPKFGIWATGVHVNGFVREGDELSMWIGRRSPDKYTAPNKLDQIVAGGRPAHLTIRQTLEKEGEEEAKIDFALAARALPVGAISYCTERREGLRRDVLYVYDLELPRRFVSRQSRRRDCRIPALADSPRPGNGPRHGRFQIQLRARGDRFPDPPRCHRAG